MATVELRIRDYIASSSGAAFLAREFARFGSLSVVARTLRKLVADKNSLSRRIPGLRPV